MVALGRDRHRSQSSRLRSEGRETLTVAGRRLLHGALAKVVTAVQEWKDLAGSGQPGPWHLGRAIEREAQMLRVREEEPWLATLIEKKMRWRNRKTHADELIEIAQDRGWRREPWDIKQARMVGQACLEILTAHTGLVEKIRIDKRWRLVATRQARSWLREADEFYELRRPVLLPTPTPPLDWPGLTGGGYADNAVLRRPLVKNRKIPAVKPEQITDLLTCVNHLQSTRWRINQEVLETISELRERGLELGEVFTPQDETPPPFIENLDETRRQAAKLQYRLVKERNAQRRGRRLYLQRLLFGVGLLGDHEFYVPHQTDFRGRVFAIPTPSIMGSDIERGLLEFAEAKPVGDGGKWLAIHGANMFGLDKVSFDARQQWVAEHEQDIRAAAADPLGATFWADAPEPLQALAFCKDYAGYLERGPAHESRLVCFADGVCNALQIYAMLLRDEKLARLTCCTADPERHDIYQRIADLVTEEMSSTPFETDREWMKVLGGVVPRELVKTPILAMVYGSTQYGQMQFVVDWFEKAALEHPWKDRYFFPCKRLSEVISKIMEQELLRAIACRRWFQRASRRVVRRDIPLIWKSPSGLKVDGTYYRQKKICISSTFQKIRIRYDDASDTETFDRPRSTRAMSAHFIHSCDAAALHKTVAKVRGRGIDSFATVHDCLGVRAADYDVASQCVREAYAETFSQPLLMNLHSQLQKLAPDAEVPYPPGRGSYDPAEVIEAPYFWS